MTKNVVFTIITLLVVIPICTSQSILNTYYNYDLNPNGVYADTTNDGGFIIAGTKGSILDEDLKIIKLDVLGNVQWANEYFKPSSQKALDIKFSVFDSCYYVLYVQNIFVGGILKLNASGLIVYDRSFALNGLRIFPGYSKESLEITSDNHLLIHACSEDTSNVRTMGLVKLDKDANPIWSRLYPYPGSSTNSIDVIECNDHNYIMLAYRDTIVGARNDLMPYIVKVDTSGNVLWENSYYVSSFTWPSKIKELSNGNFVVLGSDLVGINQQLFTMLLDSIGTKRWHLNRPGIISQVNRSMDLVENADATFTITGAQSNNSPTFNHGLAIIKMDQDGYELYSKMLSTGVASPEGKYIWPAPNNSYLIMGADSQGPFIIYADSLANLHTNYIYGRVFHDLNSNCQLDNGEPPIDQCLITINALNSVYQTSISNGVDGSFLMTTDTGTFTIRANQISPYWQYCTNPQTITFSSFFGRDTVDFPMSVSDSCSFLEVDISSPIIRRCFAANYSVNYRNRGTISAPNAHVDVALDSYLDFVSSSIPATNLGGNRYRFQLGNLNVNSAGFFNINTNVQCNANVTLGQIHCSEAHIYPDTLCSNGLWSGAVIQVDAVCNNDTAVFSITNVGFSNSSLLDFNVIEDTTIIQNSTYQLNVGQFTNIRVPTSAGKYYRIEAQQETGFPSILGDINAVSRFIYCDQSSPTLPSLPSQYYNGNGSPFISIDCQSNRGAYDPNDKSAQPIGFGSDHLVENNIPLNYHIRFQNTGTDTAFKVFIIDTLSPYLDPATLRMGASSHNYHWELRSGNILVVYFDNIMLPDSNVNEPASNGFFKFEIEMLQNLNDGIVINNKAGIYFDFNAPVFTNQTFHTIGSDFINTQNTAYSSNTDTAFNLILYPNPSEGYLYFEIYGSEKGVLQLEILDVNGRVVKIFSDINVTLLSLNCTDLNSGFYFYRCSNEKQTLKTGSFVIR